MCACMLTYVYVQTPALLYAWPSAHVLIMHSTCGVYQTKYSVPYATYGLDKSNIAT